MQISRRNALVGASAALITGAAVVPLAIKAGATKAALAMPGPRIEDIQALVADLRDCDRNIMTAVFVAFQEVADRLETLPGVVPVPSEMWCRWKLTMLGDRIGPYLTTGRARP